MNTEFDSLEPSISEVTENGFKGAEKAQWIPRGTFGGTVYELGLIRNGSLVSANTGEQGGGQN